MSHLCLITPWVGVGGWSIPGPSPGHTGAQLYKQPGHLGERGTGSRMAAPARGEVTRPLQSSSNYVSDTHSHEQTPDTSCLFLDWKSLSLLTQVVRLEHTEHQRHQQPHGCPRRGSASNAPSSFHHPFPLSWWKRIGVVCCIAAEGTTRSCPGTLARGARSPDAVLQHALPHCVDQPPLLSTKCIGPSVWPRWFRDFKKRI